MTEHTSIFLTHGEQIIMEGLQTAAADTSNLRIEIERLHVAIGQLLTCGNHIALYRTDRWPAYELDGLTRAQQCENALRILGATRDYDMWCCWSGMMQTRDALNIQERTEK